MMMIVMYKRIEKRMEQGNKPLKPLLLLVSYMFPTMEQKGTTTEQIAILKEKDIKNYEN